VFVTYVSPVIEDTQEAPLRADSVGKEANSKRRPSWHESVLLEHLAMRTALLAGMIAASTG
jgi:hypothetical protein